MSDEAPRTRDEDEFASFFHTRFNPTVRRLMAREARLPQADAEDIVSAAFREMHRDWSAVRDPEAWIWNRTLLRNIDFWRRQQLRKDAERLTDFSELSSLPSASKDGEPEECINLNHVYELIGKLSPEDQRMITRDYCGVSHEEQAKELGLSPNTFRVRLHRAKRRLEKLVSQGTGVR
ncbi:RNA polymerase sigma factor [Streptomyces mirabilis]|uniref:RNA polymerase sigma factor n=1 Tax=Streptomyces mirabilis TaxID=68239 RepID=UPI00367714EF